MLSWNDSVRRGEQSSVAIMKNKKWISGCVSLFAVVLLLVAVLFMLGSINDNQSHHHHHQNDIILLTTTAQQRTSNSDDIPMLGRVQKGKLLKENHPHFMNVPVNHFENDKTNNTNNHTTTTYKHRYYVKDTYFQGPGHPIILEVGGEEPNNYGFFYNFIDIDLAQELGALVLHPEHRFYGQAQPVGSEESSQPPQLLPTVDQLKLLLTPEQGMMDMIYIVRAYQRKLGCAKSRSSPQYCPVIAVGGSYPGFLSAMLRLTHADVVDIAYAASAPLLLYAPYHTNQFAYYDIVTRSAEKASHGCPEAVQNTLQQVIAALRKADSSSSSSDDDDDSHNFRVFAEQQLNFCPGTIPAYIDTLDLFIQEMVFIVANRFADVNMFNYPPTSQTQLAKTCHIFQDKYSSSAMHTMREFWKDLEYVNPNMTCFNMTSQLPDGPNATISGADWSGIGPGSEGFMWDFQCCYSLTPLIGFGPNSMFPYRKMTYEWLGKHCWDRFQITPDPNKLVNKWHFDQLDQHPNATRILFTNGFNDLWSAGSYLTSPTPDDDDDSGVVVINMPNGAHHSELSHSIKEHVDTPDVEEAHFRILKLMKKWVKEVKKEHE